MFEKLGSQKGETFSEKIVIKQKRLNNLTLLLMGYFLPLYLMVVVGGGLNMFTLFLYVKTREKEHTLMIFSSSF